MLSILEILLPVFGLILAGFVCGRRGILGPNAAVELNRYVVWLALPALLFDAMANTSWGAPGQGGFVAVFFLAFAGVFALTLALQMLRGRSLADASIDAMASSYPNIGYLGIPLCLMAFGQASLSPSTLAAVLVSSELIAIPSILLEIATQKSAGSPARLAWRVLVSLLRNPLILAPLAGGLLAVASVALPAPAETFLKLLSGSASPCALVSVGLFLATAGPAPNTRASDPLLLVLIKLLVQPALVWWMAAYVFELPVMLTGLAVVLAALPTGTGPFMLAEFYRREAQVASRTILISTVAAVGTLTLLLMALRLR